MTIAHESHRERIDAGIAFEWDRIPERKFSLENVDPAATSLSLHRQRRSHRGVEKLQHLEVLWAYGVDQSFLDEICTIPALRILYMETVTASDFTGLRSLPKLERLVINSATRVGDLKWAAPLKSLQSLGLENFKKVSSVEPLSALHGLRALGVEGSMWSPMRIGSLAPLSKLEKLESLFLTNLKVSDRSLKPLQGLPRLRVLQCADFYRADEMRALARANPRLRCDWFQKYAEQK